MQPSRPALPCFSCPCRTDLSSTRNSSGGCAQVERGKVTSLYLYDFAIQFPCRHNASSCPPSFRCLPLSPCPLSGACGRAWPGWEQLSELPAGTRWLSRPELAHCGRSVARTSLCCSSAVKPQHQAAGKAARTDLHCCRSPKPAAPATPVSRCSSPGSPPGHAEPPLWCGGQGRT